MLFPNSGVNLTNIFPAHSPGFLSTISNLAFFSSPGSNLNSLSINSIISSISSEALKSISTGTSLTFLTKIALSIVFSPSQSVLIIVLAFPISALIP